MANKRHRNLFRECLDAAARKRAESGLAPLTHAEWAERFNRERPTINGKKVRAIAESSVSRAASGTAGVARRIGMDRRWVLGILGVDYDTYLDAWGAGPEPGPDGGSKADAEQASGNTEVAGGSRR